MNLESMARQAVDIVSVTRQEVFADYVERQRAFSVELKYGYEIVSEVDRRASDFIIEQLDRRRLTLTISRRV